MSRNIYHPGPWNFWQAVRNVLYYIHITLATIVLAVFGLFLTIAKGREGVHRLASIWTGHLLWAARIYLGLEIEIRGKLPQGDLLIASKHHSALDILIIAHHAKQRAFIMKREVLRVPIVGQYAYKAGCIPIDRRRGKDAMKAISQTINERLRGEGLGQLIIYPEGTRTKPGERRSYKHGVSTIRMHTGLDVVPVAVNCGMFWPKGGWGIRSGRTIVEFLPAITSEMPARQFMDTLHSAIEDRSAELAEEAGLVLTQAPQERREVTEA